MGRARLLTDWLAPQYEFGFRRYLLFEQEVHGKSRSGEIDLVLFHPSYPKRLRDQTEVMISGVVAAFNVKLTLTPDGLSEAAEMAALLRRGMKPGPVNHLATCPRLGPASCVAPPLHQLSCGYFPLSSCPCWRSAVTSASPTTPPPRPL